MTYQQQVVLKALCCHWLKRKTYGIYGTVNPVEIAEYCALPLLDVVQTLDDLVSSGIAEVAGSTSIVPAGTSPQSYAGEWPIYRLSQDQILIDSVLGVMLDSSVGACNGV